MSFHLYVLLFCISLWGSTHDSAGALTDPQLPAAASNVCTTDAWLSGVGRVPLQTNILATTVWWLSFKIIIQRFFYVHVLSF